MRPSPSSRRLVALAAAAGLVLGLAPAAGADASDPGKITRSQLASPGEYPAQVGLLSPDQPDNFAGQFCGGTHILPGWVMTAAHCVDEGTGTFATPDVVLGTNDLDGSGVRVATVQTVVHPNWDPATLANDISLLRLATPVAVPFQPLVVPGLEFLEAPGPATVVGWGGLNREDQGDQEYPIQLQEGDVPIIDDPSCEAALLEYGPGSGMTLPAGQLCAGLGTVDSEPEEIDACRGDSGGPLLVPVPAGGFRQVGIVSYGPTCGFSPTVYASVASFIGFIEAATGQQVASFPDIPGNTHEANIERIAHFGVTTGNGSGAYVPLQSVNRGQMATFIGRALGLTPIPGGGSFSDIDGNAHEGYINALASAGIAGGFSDGTFRPNDQVTRGQMTTFIGRALQLTPIPDENAFSDIEGNAHQGFINALAAAGIAGGFSDGTFRPGASVLRGQMATFIARGFLGAPLG